MLSKSVPKSLNSIDERSRHSLEQHWINEIFMDLEFLNTNDILNCYINDSALNLNKDEFATFNYSSNDIELVKTLLVAYSFKK